MNVNLTDAQKQEAKRLFGSFQEICERKKELAAEATAVTEHFSRILEVKKGVGGKLLKAMMKKYEDAETTDEELVVEGLLVLREQGEEE